MKVRKLPAPSAFARKHHLTQPYFFVFCEKHSGTARFQVPAEADGSLPLEQAASLLAIHCLTRQQSPADYLVMVGVDSDVIHRVTSRATQLLESAWTADDSTPLSKRQQQVLEGVLRNLSNKEIAALLNLSERTVKFHVSTLLAKYGVSDRVSLMRHAPGSLIPFEFGGTASQADANGVHPVKEPISLDRRSRGGPIRPQVAQDRVARFPRTQAMA